MRGPLALGKGKREKGTVRLNQAQSLFQSDKDRLDAVLAQFLRKGFARSEPAVLQPAGAFLERLGEDFRGRLFLTSDDRGRDYCLRPEFTIPVCLEYLSSGLAGQPAAFAYGGPVFRFPTECEAGGEFLQAGLESFGREDREAADAEVLASAMEAAASVGSGPLELRLGDAGLVSAFLDRLDLPAAWRRRLETAYAHGDSLARIFSIPARRLGSEQPGVAAALKKIDSQDARALVNDLLALAGISKVGGRSADEIAERFLEQASLDADHVLATEKRELVETFLSVEGHPDQASATLRRLADDAKLDLSAALDSFDARSGFIAALGVDLEEATFSSSFARRLDYYSGFVFEARNAASQIGPPTIGGGRYDRLLRTLGAPNDIAAVGAAIRIDRLHDGAQLPGAAQ